MKNLRRSLNASSKLCREIYFHLKKKYANINPVKYLCLKYIITRLGGAAGSGLMRTVAISHQLGPARPAINFV